MLNLVFRVRLFEINKASNRKWHLDPWELLLLYWYVYIFKGNVQVLEGRVRSPGQYRRQQMNSCDWRFLRKIWWKTFPSDLSSYCGLEGPPKIGGWPSKKRLLQHRAEVNALSDHGSALTSAAVDADLAARQQGPLVPSRCSTVSGDDLCAAWGRSFDSCSSWELFILHFHPNTIYCRKYLFPIFLKYFNFISYLCKIIYSIYSSRYCNILKNHSSFDHEQVFTTWGISENRQAGAAVNQPDQFGQSALWRACRYGRKDLLGPLLAAQADLEQSDSFQVSRTACFWQTWREIQHIGCTC